MKSNLISDYSDSNGSDYQLERTKTRVSGETTPGKLEKETNRNPSRKNQKNPEEIVERFIKGKNENGVLTSQDRKRIIINC